MTGSPFTTSTTLAGCAIYQPYLAKGMANLSVLYVSRNYRRKGIGSPPHRCLHRRALRRPKRLLGHPAHHTESFRHAPMSIPSSILWAIAKPCDDAGQLCRGPGPER